MQDASLVLVPHYYDGTTRIDVSNALDKDVFQYFIELKMLRKRTGEIEEIPKEHIATKTALLTFDDNVIVERHGKYLYSIKCIAEGNAVVKAYYNENDSIITGTFEFIVYSGWFRDNYQKMIQDYDKQQIGTKTYADCMMRTCMEMFDILHAYIKDIQDIRHPLFANSKFVNIIGNDKGFKNIDFKNYDTPYEQLANKLYRELLNNLYDIVRLRGTATSYELLFGCLGYDIELKEFWRDSDGNFVEINPYDSYEETLSNLNKYDAAGQFISYDKSTFKDPRLLLNTDNVLINNKSCYIQPEVTIKSKYRNFIRGFSSDNAVVLEKYLQFLKPAHVEYIGTTVRITGGDSGETDEGDWGWIIPGGDDDKPEETDNNDNKNGGATYPPQDSGYEFGNQDPPDHDRTVFNTEDGFGEIMNKYDYYPYDEGFLLDSTRKVFFDVNEIDGTYNSNGIYFNANSGIDVVHSIDNNVYYTGNRIFSIELDYIIDSQTNDDQEFPLIVNGYTTSHTMKASFIQFPIYAKTVTDWKTWLNYSGIKLKKADIIIDYETDYNLDMTYNISFGSKTNDQTSTLYSIDTKKILQIELPTEKYEINDATFSFYFENKNGNDANIILNMSIELIYDMTDVFSNLISPDIGNLSTSTSLFYINHKSDDPWPLRGNGWFERCQSITEGLDEINSNNWTNDQWYLMQQYYPANTLTISKSLLFEDSLAKFLKYDEGYKYDQGLKYDTAITVLDGSIADNADITNAQGPITLTNMRVLKQNYETAIAANNNNENAAIAQLLTMPKYAGLNVNTLNGYINYILSGATI